MMEKIEIYTTEICGWAKRNILVCLEKDLEYSLVNVNENGKKPDWFLQMTPYGKTPVIRHDGCVVFESLIMNEYLNENFPGRDLMPSTAGERAQARNWMHYCDNMLVPQLKNIAQAQVNSADEIQEHVDTISKSLTYIEERGFPAGSDFPFWFGKELSLLDICYDTFFDALSVTEEIINEPILGDFTAHASWRQALLAHPNMIKANKILEDLRNGEISA
jgi:glutathione S-transferase